MYASRMFHSFGTVQSKTSVPLGTSWSSKGMRSPIRRRVSRIPSPVMLRQIGNSSSMNRNISAPVFSASSPSIRSRMAFSGSPPARGLPCRPRRGSGWAR